MAESATMALLKGKGKAKAAPAESVDDELKAPETTQDEDGGEAPGSPEPDEAVEIAQDDGDGAVMAAPETEEATDDADATEAEPEATGVAIPTSKTEVHALKMAELPAVHEALGSPVEGFAELDLKGKKQALLDHLFPKGGKAKVSIGGSDQLATIAKEIEDLKTRGEVEDKLGEIAQVEGENFFRKGGLLVKLSEIGDFGEHKNFQDYVKANGIAPDYRTARYWMSIYTGLLEAGIPYSEVQGVGWTKIVVLIPVLTKENVAEWVAKAKAMNVATLQATVDAATAQDTSGSASTAAPSGDIKSMVFKLHKDQTDTINDAIAKAKKNASTESKEVALDLICVEYLGVASSKKQAPAEAAPAKEVGYDTDNLDVGLFLKAVAAKYPTKEEAMGFLFANVEDGNPEHEDKCWFEILWPQVELKINIPDS